MSKSKILMAFVLVLVVVSFTSVMLAQGAAPGLGAPDKPTGLFGSTNDTFTAVLKTIINLALGVVTLLAVGYLIYGGFRYITSGGDSEAAEAGKNAIRNSLIGLIIIILSYVIITVIFNAFFRLQV